MKNIAATGALLVCLASTAEAQSLNFEQAAYKVSLEELRYIAASQALKDFVARISPSR